jgi:hypothetical protein
MRTRISIAPESMLRREDQFDMDAEVLQRISEMAVPDHAGLIDHECHSFAFQYIKVLIRAVCTCHYRLTIEFFVE